MNLPPFPPTMLRDLYPSNRERPHRRDERHSTPPLALALSSIAAGWRTLLRSRELRSCNRTLSETPEES